ncbi:MAG: hypothetical protein NC412_03860 [Roseburia sp.]|nr:hypothetical protein [Roseburia sp.]MCM1278266.1 hypothetical protein [Robinsoniella sp.]
MDKAIREFLMKEIRLKKYSLAPLDMLLLIGTAIAGACLRESVITYVPLETAGAVSGQWKLFSMIFDVFLAVLMLDAVTGMTGNKIKGFLAYGVMLLLPVLAASSAMWGMGDQVYVFFALLGITYTLKGKGNLGLCSLGISILLNTNGLFLLPVFFGLYLRKEVKAAAFLAPLAGLIGNRLLVAGILPIRISFMQAEALLAESRKEALLSYHYPNIYQIFGVDKFVTEYSQAAFWFVICLGAIIGVWMALRKKPLTKERLLLLFVFSAMVIPYFAPFMNERSGMLADVAAVLLGFVILRKFYVPLVQVIISYVAYSAYFRGESVIPMAFVAAASLLLIMDLIREET